MKAIPTRYGGVCFRSRLEARWAAFFDLAGIKWDYEPLDLDGWAPDFELSLRSIPVFAEIKPIPVVQNEFGTSFLDANNDKFEKAFKYWDKVQVLLLGAAPQTHGIGALLDPPAGSKYHWVDAHDQLIAGNRVQWHPPT